MLLFFSVLFYMGGEGVYLWLILVSVVVNYIFGFLISHYHNTKIILRIAVIINLSALIYYKYSYFLTHIFTFENKSIDKITLPLGISFYTFHSISYLVDIYRKKSSPQSNIMTMGLYIINFSQLVAGPIIRYHDVQNQLNNRSHLWNRFGNGVKLFIYGLAKKMIIANTVGAFADAVFDHSFGNYNSWYAWLGLFSYTLQIYFDFSGYSDMAIGIGRMFGFEFKQNFNLPYAAKSIKEFWQKWHISLSSWFRDYVYIPLGGNKHGHYRTAFNLLLVFVLCGLWHGANYTFLVWGLFHGFFITAERLMNSRFKLTMPSFISHIYVWLVIMIGWVFFRATNLDGALDYINHLFHFNPINNSPDLKSFVNPYFIAISSIGFLASLGIFKRTGLHLLKSKTITTKSFRILESILLLLIFYWCVLEIINSHFNPFIYYRF